MPQDMKVILIASFGSLTQEFLHWYNLRTQLSMKHYKIILHSSLYWTFVVGFILISGIFTWAWYQGDGINHLLREYLLTGAAFPLILKKAISALNASTEVKLGIDKGSIMRDYFQINTPNVSEMDDSL
jgi:hypothetical protein